ncbi:hypothetical protein [Flexithrix dorotheae]|uniref:hypothetical protein n=1 Tax=Flexithrix dorotheae TaxID=70993 RepID=UPI00037F385F|nr:hypothetical protein [Flexithrix dorotheae]
MNIRLGLYYVVRFYRRNINLFSFLSVLLLILVLDFLFKIIVPDSILATLKGIYQKEGGGIDYVPEVWLGLFALVLGTLIIVISIASQKTPKLIDLYIGDQVSLFYIWFIALGLVHNMYLQLYKNELDSVIFNTYFLLPLAMVFSTPYVLSMLHYTKTSNVIRKIFKTNKQLLSRLSNAGYYNAIAHEELQGGLFNTLNQLDELLQFVEFKEPKADIIQKISTSVQSFIAIKGKINPKLFDCGKLIQSDVSFKTMTGYMEELSQNRTFYELKGFRLLSNAYLKLIESGEFDLAALCAHEFKKCGEAAIKAENEKSINLVFIQFNTLLRFGIKQGTRENEARNLFNTIFHYGELIQILIRYNSPVFGKESQEALIKKSCQYLHLYTLEMYRLGQEKSSFLFLVDVFTWELKTILKLLFQLKFNDDLQKEMLLLFLKFDDRPDLIVQENIYTYNYGVRTLQIILALFYIHFEKTEFAILIIDDILEDHQSTGKASLNQAVETTCERISNTGPGFWEETDRGNANFYHSDYKDALPKFKEIFQKEMDKFFNNS